MHSRPPLEDYTCPVCKGLRAYWDHTYLLELVPIHSLLRVCPACRGTGRRQENEDE